MHIRRTKYRRLFASLICIGTVKQTETKLHPKNPADGFIDCCLTKLAFAKERRRVRYVQPADHFHVHSGSQRGACSFRFVTGQTVVDQLPDRLVVADNESRELPFAAQNLGKGEWICRSRYPVEIVECAHKRSDSGVNCGLERG